ncbi:hypothetical protein LDENG_00099020 [Lucifuga dentata]|nr:hypothetical protein LDENG_00099020 [Lucifuga dentata]
MALQSLKTISDESLENMRFLDAGGFGDVFKAKYKDLVIDVAIKIHRNSSGSVVLEQSELWQEFSNMREIPNPFVVSVYGIYKGFPPGAGSSEKQGIVMEFVDKGSIQSMQRKLGGHPPPWPLAFRLALQVAQGMNFLHSKELVHKDLKPSNVLLDKDLNAKIADFGLSRVSTSVLGNSKTTGVNGGSYKYMPPEAFDASYECVRDYDVYSYGILLWTILTGKEPYRDANESLVRTWISIPTNRPSVNEIDQTKADGLKEVVDLMTRCWDKEPSVRPKFKECIKVTESVFKRHEKRIRDAVGQVLNKLDQDPTTSDQQSNTVTTQSQQAKTAQSEQPDDIVDHPRPAQPAGFSQQDSVDKMKANFVNEKRPHLTQKMYMVMAVVDELGDKIHPEIYSRIRNMQTNPDRVRELYETILRSGGVKAKVAFYDAIKTHQPDLLE